MRHETVLTLEYDSASDATVVERSLEPEIDDIEGDRTTAALSRDGDEIRIAIDAADLVSLRAGQNTWLTLVGVAERCAAAGADVSGTS